MDTVMKILSIGIGGAAGAVARYLITVSPLSNLLQPFPLPTFLINVTGSFLIGILLVLFADRFAVSENVRSALVVGFLGAYTTFSAFEFELYGLAKGKDYLLAFVYLILSVAVGFVAVVGGVWFAKRF